MKDLNYVYRDITEFIFVEHAPSPADLIILVGGSDPSLAVMAADLYHQKMAPKILAGGRYSLKLGHFANEKLKGTPYEGQMFETEAAFYRHILLEHHVPTEDILLEEASTNTGENAAFALKLTREREVAAGRLLIVCKNFHARRCLMTFNRYFPDSLIRIIPVAGRFSPEMAIGSVAGVMDRNHWFEDSDSHRKVMGELERCGRYFANLL